MSLYVIISIILSFNLEICLWMIAYRTFYRSFLAYHNVSAVSTLPNNVTVF